MTPALSQSEQAALLEGLASASEEVRRLAVEQLLLLPAPEAVPLLIERLGDDAWRVRKAAIDRLVACRDDSLVHPGLRSALADGENPGRRNAAFEAFVAMGVRATPALLDATTSSDVDVRKLAVDALAAVGDTAARDALVHTLTDPDANVRAAAADALGVVGGVVAVGALLRTGTNGVEAPLVRLSALRSLERLEASVGVESISDALAHPQLRPAALELLGHSTDPAASSELEKGLSSSVRSIRESAICALLRQLARLDGTESDALCERMRATARADAALVLHCCVGLAGEDLSRRLALVQFLGVIADERAILPLLEAGRDETLGELVDATLEALAAITVRGLQPVWGELEVDAEVRACGILGRIGGDAAEALLVATLQGASGRAVGCAAMALGEGGFFRRMPDLVRRLDLTARAGDQQNGDEIEQLIAAIVRMADQARSSDAAVHVQLIEVLASRLAGAPEALRVAIARVLARIGRAEDADVVEYLSKDASPLVRRAAVLALGRLDLDRVRQAIRLALGDESSGVRIAAAGVLGSSGSRDALEDLARLSRDREARGAAAATRAAGELLEQLAELAPGDVDWLGRAVLREPLVALAALEALTNLGGRIAVGAATSALSRSEPEIVRAAVACLGRHGSGEELSPLLALVAHADWTVRAEAVQVLAARRLRRALPAMLRRLEVEDDLYVREIVLSAARRIEE